MKTKLAPLLQQALDTLKKKNTIDSQLEVEIHIEPTRDLKHGDYASNLALMLAKPAKLAPRAIAEQLIAQLPECEWLEEVTLAGPGFINFTVKPIAYHDLLNSIVKQKAQFGCLPANSGDRIYLEYVSCNPTGPLHVGHGRNAAFGACCANLLQAAGHKVHREYYVNDAGRQMQILALSTWIRYCQQLGSSIQLPPNAYQGEYIFKIAKVLYTLAEDKLFHSQQVVTDHLNFLLQKQNQADQESQLDALIATMQHFIGQQSFNKVQQLALDTILSDIKQDLDEFGVQFDRWFHESELTTQGLIDAGIELLDQQGHVYERDGATWFRATDFDDEKDRVLVRENGNSTYFASDVAYHLYKYQQGFDRIIDVFGADHHGYQARIRAFLQGLGEDPGKLKIVLIQFVALYRAQTKVSMSTRQGKFISLRELREEVGNDAARFFYVMRKAEQHLDFDLELAKSTSNENPVYYIQYAHARICSVWRQLEQEKDKLVPAQGLSALELLSNSHEKKLLRHLAQYPECIQHSASHFEPHNVAHYLQELANLLHSYYNAERFLVADSELRQARLCLISAVQQVLANGLGLLGVSAPEEM